MPYVATMNTPGYSPWQDDPPIFDSALDAWRYLRDERKRAEEDTDDDGPYSDTVTTLDTLSLLHGSYGLVNERGEGTVYGDTPGYNGDHDLGIAYCVSWTDETPDTD